MKTCPDLPLCQAGDACAGHCRKQPIAIAEIPSTSQRPREDLVVFTPDDLHHDGYRIHFSRDDSPPVNDRYSGTYWWTWTRDNVMDIVASPGEWRTLDEAVADARGDLAKDSRTIQ